MGVTGRCSSAALEVEPHCHLFYFPVPQRETLRTLKRAAEPAQGRKYK